MSNQNKTMVTKNLKERSVTVTREFDAPLAHVWRAYTEKELLDQWWGPEPWRAETKSMNFKEGGYWLYAMVGPQNEKHWGRMNYIRIEHHKHFDIEDCFCDENGTVNSSLPVSTGRNQFAESTGQTRVEMKFTYATEEDLQKIVEMGFEEGISMCLEQLVKVLAKMKK